MQTRGPVPYVGRFAPSPTGPLHFGSLVAAVASYLQSRVNNGRWLLRIEDIDPPREQAGASEQIVKALHHYGFEWDGDVIFQRNSGELHERAIHELLEKGWAYRCRCSRSDLSTARSGPLGRVYPGTCRDAAVTGESAIRVRTDDSGIEFDDGLQDHVVQQLESESGDFVIRRRDGLAAYHLAVVVDDASEGVTEIVRGIDLLDSTPRQIWLQRLLHLHTPRYFHIPVITHPDGSKLSKLTGAAEISMQDAELNLVRALRDLQQQPPADLARADLKTIWTWARENWQLGQLSNLKTVVDSP